MNHDFLLINRICDYDALNEFKSFKIARFTITLFKPDIF